MKHQLMVLSALFLCLALGACSPAGEGPVPLTQEEIDQVNAAFSSTVEEENVVWSTPVSGFFTSRYADVRELDFVEFLRYFPGDGTLEDTDQEEFAALKMQYTAFRLKWLESEAESAADGQKMGVLFEEGLTPVEVRKLADRIQQKAELAAVADKLVKGEDLRADPLTAAHADWAEGFAPSYTITADNALDIVYKETGLVFAKVLEHAGVYARTPEGQDAFLRFLRQV